MIYRLSVFFVLLLAGCSASTKQNDTPLQGVETPIMGWSSWNNYRIHINDSIIRTQADAMATNGMAEAGYNFINIDDGFFLGRDSQGRLLHDDSKFPNGMKSLADYIHSKGLKAGIYTDAGQNTCGSIWDADKNGIGVGVFGHEQQDFPMFFNEWGYDFIKIDWCGAQQQKLDEESVYTALIQQVKQTRPDVVFNICRWQFPGTWACPIADSWRFSGDINASFNSICHIIDKNMFLAPYASPGHFNDMDMLQVGRGMSADEDRAHFTMWCMMASPLLAGNDLATMSDETRKILTNREVIALNQDKAGIQAHITQRINGVEMWVKHLVERDGLERAVALFNRGDQPTSVTIDLADAGLTGVRSARDLWNHIDIGTESNMLTVDVPAHGIRAFRVIGTGIVIPDVYEAEYGFVNHLGRNNGPGFSPDDGFSGGYGVKGLGADAGNWLEFRHILMSESGERTITIAASEKLPDSLEVEINGQKCAKYDADTWKAQFNNGYNVVKIYSSTEVLPIIDHLRISK
jgi:hypothetical protein